MEECPGNVNELGRIDQLKKAKFGEADCTPFPITISDYATSIIPVWQLFQVQVNWIFDSMTTLCLFSKIHFCLCLHFVSPLMYFEYSASDKKKAKKTKTYMY